MGVAERQLLKHLMGGGKISNVQDEHHPLAILLRVPLIDLTIQIEVCSRTSSGRIAKTLSRSTPGLMVPIARIFVVGVDCMAVCPYPVVKAKHHGKTGDASVLHLPSPFDGDRG